MKLAYARVLIDPSVGRRPFSSTESRKSVKLTNGRMYCVLNGR